MKEAHIIGNHNFMEMEEMRNDTEIKMYKLMAVYERVDRENHINDMGAATALDDAIKEVVTIMDAWCRYYECIKSGAVWNVTETDKYVEDDEFEADSIENK